MLYGPTNEEMITDIFRSYVKSYKNLPLNLYHIQLKFRDEVRPRFGTMRSREFLMKDAYSFDLTKEDAIHSYNKMFVAYLRTFERLGLRAIPMRADTGPIGGNHSHEFIILADTGRSKSSATRASSTAPFPLKIPISTMSRRFKAFSTNGRPITPPLPKCTTKPPMTPFPMASAFPHAVSKSAISSISAPNIPSRWARKCRAGRQGTPCPHGFLWHWADTPCSRHH